MSLFQKFMFWLIHTIPLGRLSPWILRLALGKKPRKVKGEKDAHL